MRGKSPRPAPLPGEQSVAIVRDWLGADPNNIKRLIAAKVLQPTEDTVFNAIYRMPLISSSRPVISQRMSEIGIDPAARKRS
jgi:hypothetical protein